MSLFSLWPVLNTSLYNHARKNQTTGIEIMQILKVTVCLWLIATSSSVTARFVTPDPVPTDPNTGESFNRYNYAANNPYKFTDPDGRTIVLGGDEKYKAETTSRLASAGAAHPAIAAGIHILEKSEYVHRIVPTSENPDYPGRTATVSEGGPIENEANSVGIGSVTYYDPNVSLGKPGSDYGTPEGVIAHEVVGHAYDRDQGRVDYSDNPKTGHPVGEEKANQVEKMYVDGKKADDPQEK